MNEIKEETLLEIESQLESWHDFINSVLGLASFTFALACLGTPWPSQTAVFSLLFVLLMAWSGHKRFPPKLKLLRKKKTDRFG